MTGINSRRKGKTGELQLVRKLREYGWDCRRGQQYCGANGDADVVGIPGIHIECKRRNRLDPYEFISQARRDAGNLAPVVFMRRDREDWLVLMDIDTAMEMIAAWVVDHYGGDEDGHTEVHTDRPAECPEPVRDSRGGGNIGTESAGGDR